MKKEYIDTVRLRLLLEIAPAIFRSGTFAMKGGTAIIKRSLRSGMRR